MESKLDRRWLAGFFDGEGTIGMYYRIYPSGKINFKRYVYLANTRLDILESVKSEFGGYIRMLHKKLNRERPCYQWQASGTLGNKFLSEIKDYLLVKNEQCDLWFQFSKTVTEGRLMNFKHGATIDSDLTKSRIVMINRTKQLNQRGVISAL